MTKLLEEVFKEASKLPEVEQNSLAKWITEELKSERKWEQSFTESEDIFRPLADEALVNGCHSAIDILARAPGHRLFKSAAEVDDYLRKERDS